jgi:hypothetical protein
MIAATTAPATLPMSAITFQNVPGMAGAGHDLWKSKP